MDPTCASPKLASRWTAVVFLLAILSASCDCSEAYTFAPSPFLSSKVRYTAPVVQGKGLLRRRDEGSSVTLYLFPMEVSTRTSPLTAANLLKPSTPSSSGSLGRNSNQNQSSRIRSREETQLPAMSQSVLATCDTLPSFATAHGALSPEVVSRIADRYDLEEDDALHRFLKTYKREGPLACLPMLSDPAVLPELTKAMRDIA